MSRKILDAEKTLQTLAPPKFANPEHEARLLALLKTVHAERDTEATGEEPKRGFRLGWATAVVVGLALIGLVAVQQVLAPRSVRAEAMAALGDATKFVLTATSYRLSEEGMESTEMAVLYYENDTGMAMHSPSRRAWNVNGDMITYDVNEDRVTVMRGIGTVPAPSLLSQYRVLAGFGPEGTEQDHGLVELEGKTLRLVEVFDPNDPTQRVEIYVEPESKLPVEVITYNRNEAGAEWRLARTEVFEYDVVIDPAVLQPDYPETAEVVEREPSELERAAVSGEVGAVGDIAWMQDALDIAWFGDKCMAVEGVWLSPEGWVGVKFRTNIETPFVIPMEFCDDPANQARWNADRFLLNNLAGGTLLTSDSGPQYFARNGANYTQYSDGTHGYVYYYEASWGEFPVNGLSADQFVFRTLAVARDRGRGESLDHYWDWKENPGQWNLIELTIPAPAPSELPPPCFNDDDLAWLQRTGVAVNAGMNWIDTMRREKRQQEVYNVMVRKPLEARRLYGFEWVMCLRELDKSDEAYAEFVDAPQEDRCRLGAAWMSLLVELGKLDEARAFMEQYREYIVRTMGDGGADMIEQAERILQGAQGGHN